VSHGHYPYARPPARRRGSWRRQSASEISRRVDARTRSLAARQRGCATGSIFQDHDFTGRPGCEKRKWSESLKAFCSITIALRCRLYRSAAWPPTPYRAQCSAPLAHVRFAEAGRCAMRRACSLQRVRDPRPRSSTSHLRLHVPHWRVPVFTDYDCTHRDVAIGDHPDETVVLAHRKRAGSDSPRARRGSWPSLTFMENLLWNGTQGSAASLRDVDAQLVHQPGRQASVRLP
jgi:hypothetical protein